VITYKTLDEFLRASLDNGTFGVMFTDSLEVITVQAKDHAEAAEKVVMDRCVSEGNYRGHWATAISTDNESKIFDVTINITAEANKPSRPEAPAEKERDSAFDDPFDPVPSVDTEPPTKNRRKTKTNKKDV